MDRDLRGLVCAAGLPKTHFSKNLWMRRPRHCARPRREHQVPLQRVGAVDKACPELGLAAVSTTSTTYEEMMAMGPEHVTGGAFMSTGRTATQELERNFGYVT
jgi:hypothetical protein